MVNWKSFGTRTITGIIYVALILGAIISNQVLAIGSVLTLFAMLGSYEYLVMSKSNIYTLFLKIWHALMAGLVMYISYTITVYTEDRDRLLLAMLPYCAYFLFYLIGEIYRLKRMPEREIAQAFFAHLYVAVPLGFLILITGDQYGIADKLGEDFLFPRTFWLLPIFILLWVNDTGAYLCGSLFGRHKLLQRVSPHKTWEGAIGGAVLVLIASHCFHLIFPEVATTLEWMGLGLIILFFGTFGDLFESFIKRSCGVKDSGDILPGHGGILDRIDSLIFVSIPVFFYINMVII